MKTLFSNEVAKLLLFFVASYLLAALIVPQAYNLGQFLAEVTASKSVNPILDALGAQARQSDYAHFFKRSLYLAGLILLPFLLVLFSSKKAAAKTRGPWSFALPARSLAFNRGQALVRPPHPGRQILGGFCLGAVFLSAAGALALSLGYFQGNGATLRAVIPSAFLQAILFATLAEILFRGVILGLFLRTFRPSLAIVFAGALFAILSFLHPAQGPMMPNPEGLWTGFAYLWEVSKRLLDWELMLREFTPLFLMGVILGVCRYLTSSLWLPIGLHAGWAFAYLTFTTIVDSGPPQSGWSRFVGGETLAQGLLPLATLMLSSLIIWVVYREPDDYEEPHPNSPLDPAPH